MAAPGSKPTGAAAAPMFPGFGNIPFPSPAAKGDQPFSFLPGSAAGSILPMGSKFFPASDDKGQGAFSGGLASFPKEPAKGGVFPANQENMNFSPANSFSTPNTTLIGTPLATTPKTDGAASKAAAAAAPAPRSGLHALRTSTMSLPPTVGSDPMLFASKPAPPKEAPGPATTVSLKSKPASLPSHVTQTLNRWHATINSHIQEAFIEHEALQAKESQLHASRARIEELQCDAQNAQRLAAEISSELDRSWKDLAQLEAALEKLETELIDTKDPKKMGANSEERNAMVDVAVELIGNLNVVDEASQSALGSARTHEADVCHTMNAEKDIQEMLHEQHQLLQMLDAELRHVTSAIQVASAPAPPAPPSPSPLRSPAPSPLQRARTTPSRSILSPLSQRSSSLPVSASFGD